ncbi:MAG: hypothetical protein U9N41_00850 [Euryarchaeota archaeon]|nr:hypothetical protein [Euryarchaeota archaeon]
MKASADASVIIDLPKDELLIKIAKKRYSEIYVPKEVLDEHKKPKKHVQRIRALEREGFIERKELDERGIKYYQSFLKRGKLGGGECAAIALALQLGLPEVLLDDKLAISTASKVGLKSVSICYLPLWGFKKDFVTSDEAEYLLRKLFTRSDPNLLVLMGILRELERSM